MRISDWSSGVCSSDLTAHAARQAELHLRQGRIARSGQDELVDLLVQLEVVAQGAGLVLAHHALVQLLNARDLGIGDVTAGELAGQRLQRAHDREGLIEVGQGELRHRARSEEHTSELQSLMRLSDAVFCLKKKKTT